MTRHRFEVRLSTSSSRDMQLRQFIENHRQEAEGEGHRVNVSEIFKELAYQWYMMREQLGYDPPFSIGFGQPYLEESRTISNKLPARPSLEEEEDPDDPLVKTLAGLNFDQQF